MTFRDGHIIIKSGDVMDDIKPEQLADIYRDMSEIVGIEKTVLIYSAFKGQQVSFPVHLFSAEYMRRCIRDEFDGTNIRQLALKYGYSERWIREIIKNNTGGE